MEQLSKKEISKKLYNYISNEFLILFFFSIYFYLCGFNYRIGIFGLYQYLFTILFYYFIIKNFLKFIKFNSLYYENKNKKKIYSLIIFLLGNIFNLLTNIFFIFNKDFDNMSRIYFSGTYFYLGISFYILFIITFIFYHFAFERDIVYEFNYLNGNNYYSYKDLNDYSELLNFIYKDKSYKEGKLIYNPYFFFLVITMPAFSTTCFSFISEVNLNNNASFIVFSLIYLIIPQALTSSMYLFKKSKKKI